MYLADAASVQPDAGSLEQLRVIFRAGVPEVAAESFISFHHGTEDGSMRAVECLRLSDLAQGWLPGMVEQLQRDGYYCLSPLHAKPRGWPFKQGSASQLRFLTAVAVDLDGIGRADSTVTQGQAYGILYDASLRGEIPRFSVFVDSGRGCWFLWLLCDRDDSTKPPRAHESVLRMHRRVQSALQQRVLELPRGAEMAPDPSVTAQRQLIRVPDTINSKSGRPVEYSFRTDADGRVFVYSLDDLAAALGVQLRAVEQRTARAVDPAHRARGVRGQAAVILNRVRDVEMLDEHRGGFREGERGRALFMYALHLLRVSGVSRDDVRERVLMMAARCRTTDGRGPLPYPAMAARRIVAEALKATRSAREWRLSTFARWLRVTAAEVEALAPDGFLLPAAGSRAADDGAVSPTQCADRRAVLHDIAAGYQLRGELMPTCVELAGLLRLEGVASVTAEQVRQDMEALGFPRRKRGRPSEQLPLRCIGNDPGAFSPAPLVTPPDGGVTVPRA